MWIIISFNYFSNKTNIHIFLCSTRKFPILLHSNINFQRNFIINFSKKMITVTEKAKERIINLRTEEGKDESFNLRVGVVGQGCSGLSYTLIFDDTTQNGDTTIDLYEVKIIIDKKSLLYLVGTQLDYSDGLNGKGFIWNNPAASRVCGCGSSFSV